MGLFKNEDNAGFNAEGYRQILFQQGEGYQHDKYSAVNGPIRYSPSTVDYRISWCGQDISCQGVTE